MRKIFFKYFILLAPLTTDPGTSPLPTENMSTGGQSPGQLATSPTTSMEINHPSPPKETSTDQQQQQITSDVETTAN